MKTEKLIFLILAFSFKQLKYKFMPIFKYCILASVFLFFLLTHNVFAAVIYILPEEGSFTRGETVNIDIKINSEGEGVNAAQGKINWPANILEFIEVSKEGSAFNFWLEEPTLSSASNSLSFIGGAAKGISGEALQVLKIKFKIVSAETAEVSISDAAVTASDGKGTNVLSKVKGASYGAGAEVEFVPAMQPARVERKAVLAQNLPQKPEIKIAQYSDEKRWYDYLGEVVALWDVSADVISAAAVLDHSPNTIPNIAEKELATGRNFGVLEDGIWYVHARFRNNIGWGPAAHYRIALDTQPPLSFEINVLEGEKTDNPAPVIRFESSDSLSGLEGYEIKIDSNEAVKISATEFAGSFTLPLQAPGVHKVIVKAIDKAGNGVEDSVNVETLPIFSPIITFVTRELFSEEERGLSVKGTALPNINVLLRIKQTLGKERGEVIAEKTAQTDSKGNWEFTFDEPLRNGKYVLTAQGQDARGALSLIVESQEIRVKPKPIIQIGKFQLGMGGALIFLLIVIAGGFGGGVWFYKKRQGKLALRLFVVKTDMEKVFKLIQDDVEKLQQAGGTPTDADDKFIIKRLQENIKRMEGYLKKEIEKAEL